ncbi:MAG: hypothetical protein WCQ00_00290 [bacterium]
MADKKPDAKKPASAGASDHMFALEIKIFSVVAFIVLIYLATGKRVLENLGYGQGKLTTDSTGFINQALDSFNSLFNMVIFFSVFLILFFLLASFYLKNKQKEIVTLYKTSLPKGYIASISSTAGSQSGVSQGGVGEGVSEGGTDLSAGKPVLNPSGENKKWEDILGHIASTNSSDWRMAILEADILLYEMLDQMGYDGDTIADKLKAIESSDFNTLDLAWRAHKVRNTIAHEGSSYELSHEQAQNTIDLYRKVFAEFYFI